MGQSKSKFDNKIFKNDFSKLSEEDPTDRKYMFNVSILKDPSKMLNSKVKLIFNEFYLTIESKNMDYDITYDKIKSWSTGNSKWGFKDMNNNYYEFFYKESYEINKRININIDNLLKLKKTNSNIYNYKINSIKSNLIMQPIT